MAENRSLRVVLSADVSPYVTGMARAATATKSIAVAAAEVRTKLNELGNGQGLNNLARDLTKVGLAVRGLSGARDIALLANGIRTLSGAGSGLTAAVNDIRRFATAVRSIDSASAAGMRDISTALHGLGSLSMGGASAEITAMSTGIRRLIRDANSVPAIRALATALRDLGAAGGGLGNLGNVGGALRGMQSQIDQLRRSIAGLRGTAGGGGAGGGSGSIFGSIFGGAALANIASNAAMRAFSLIGTGLKDTAKATADYETEIQTFGAVTKASNAQMKQASDLAIKLGGDVTIAGASASDAAGVLTELAKGGLSISQSFDAAKGSLQLASAASVDMGTAAGIQTAAINSFALDASSAGKVADILANTAAAASGEITDFAEGMKQSGAVAHNFGMSLLENQTILAQFAQAGIKGSMGGNILKSALLSVEKASGPSGKALAQMGVEVKKSNGEYITAAELEEQLAGAKKRMGTTAYNTAAAVAFGTRGVIFANVAANQGADGFNNLSNKISAGAGAAAFSAAKMSGLGGAMKNVQNQFETAQVVIGEKFSGALQTALNGVSKAIPVLTSFLTGGSIGAGVNGIGKWFAPLIDGAKALITTAAPYVSAFVGSLARGFGSVLTFIKPVADGIGNFFKNLSSGGTVDIFGKALTAVGRGFEGLMKWLAPVGQVIGDVAGWLGKLPAPIYLGAAALGAFLLLRGPLNSMLLQATFGYARLATSISGLASAGIMSGIKRLGSGLLGALGGPVGLAITGVTVGLGFLFSAMGSGKQETEDLKGEIDAITASLNTNTGAITDNTRATVADNLQKNGTVTAAKNLGLNLADLESAALGSSDGMSRLNLDIGASVQRTVAASDEYAKFKDNLDAAGISSQDLAKAVQSGDWSGVKQKYDAYVGSIKDSTRASAAATEEQTALNGLAAAAPGIWGPYADVLGHVGDQSKGIAEGQQTVADKIALTTQASKDYASGGVSGMLLANEAAQISAGKTATALGTVTSAVKIAADDTSGFFEMVVLKKDTAAVALTPMQQAFEQYNQAVSDADTTTQLFMLTMDKLAGRDVSVEDAMAANSAAAQSIGSASRQAVQNQIDARKAEADVRTAQANLDKMETVTKTDDKGKEYKVTQRASDATTQDDITAAKLRAADANAKVASSQADINKADTDYQKTAALRLTQVVNQAKAAGNFAGTVKAVTGEMKKQRDQFIKQKEDNGASPAEAAAAADRQSLKTDVNTITTIITADPSQAQAAFKDMTQTVKDYSGQVDRIPASKKTLFNAEVAIAEKNGTRLYQVYDAASGKFVTRFETPDVADAQVRAGGLVKQYDKAKGTWTATLQVKDNASGEALAAKAKIDLATKDRTTKFTAATKDAIGDIGLYGMTIKLFPKDVKTQFDADVKTASDNGKGLYRVYDATKKTWKAQFETPGSAESQRKAGALVEQYNKAKGTWTANLIAEDAASSVIGALETKLQNMKDKTVKLTVAQQNEMGQAQIDLNQAVDAARNSATGGYIAGPGTGTSDDIPVNLSNGEYVIKASQTRKHLPLLHAINNGADIGPAMKFADGGLVDVKMSSTGDAAAGAQRSLSAMWANVDKQAAKINAAAAAQAAAMQASSGLLGNNDPSSYGWQVGANIVPYSFHGVAFPSGVAKGTTPLWNSLLSALEPTIPGGIRPGEDWGYENRDNVNNPGKKSMHAYGLALDVNSTENPNLPGTVGSRGTGKYMIPNSAGALARAHNMLWGGEWGDAMHFELHESPTQVAGGGSSSGGGAFSAGASNAAHAVLGAIGGLLGGGSGVERWRALANKVADAEGQDRASVDVMLSQMNRESSGNVNAINLTDSNAQAGHPSKGLLQFIDSTFRAYAEPGFNSDIYDPESQMRAWYHYLQAQYGGWYAYSHRGGDVYGAYANGGLVSGPGGSRSDSIPARVSNGEYIVNAASTAKHLPLLSAINGYADGGLVGSLTALSGRTAASAGPELSQVVQALQDIAQAVSDARQAMKDKSDLAVTARGYAVEKEDELREAIRTKASKNAIAQARVRATTADRDYRTALRTYVSYRNAATAADGFQKAQQRAYQTQQAYAARVDRLSTSLQLASDKLGQQRADRASMMSGISSTVSGFDGGITGHNDTRTTFATILKGQQYDEKQAQAFNVNVMKLRKLGLSNSSINSIASAGVDGGGVTAAALAKASPAQIKALNGVTSHLSHIGDNVGNVVAGQFYDAGIAAGTGLVKGLQSQIGAIQKVMNSVATSVVTTLTSKLQIHSPSRVMHGHGVNIVDGLNNGILAGQGKVASSMAGLVQAPNIPAQSYARAAAGPQAIDVQVFLDGKRIDDRIDVRVNGFTADFTHRLYKAGMQSA